MRPLADHVERAGLDLSMPLAVARVGGDGAIEALAAGRWPNGQPVSISDRFYTASLAKQVTGVAAAMLTRDGRLDADQPIGSLLDDLPAWANGITPRQLAHHVAGLPVSGELEARISGDWTEAAAFAAFRAAELSVPPGIRYGYSNIGYILLARIVAIASGQPFAEFVEARISGPNGVAGMAFTSDPSRYQQTPMLGSCLPLTQGDGGLWSSASAYAQWLHLNNVDAFGVASIVETPGRVDDGSEVDYGWGVGLRWHREHRLFSHAGEWPGAVAKAVRCPALGIGLVALAAGAPLDAVDRLVASLLSDF